MSSTDDPPKPDQPSDAPVEPSPSGPPDYKPLDASTGQPLPESGTSGTALSESGTSDTKLSTGGTSDTKLSTGGTSGPTVVVDDAILPATLGDTALHDAVGVKARRRPDTEDRDDDDDDRPPRVRNRRTIVVATVSILLGLLVATLVFLGRANAQRYIINCTSTQVTAEQGRGFPPWGTHPLTAPEWKPIALPSVAECKPRETEELDELGKWYLDMLVDRATAILTARNVLDGTAQPAVAGAPAATNPLDLAAAELEQALLLARNPDRRDQRKDVERLLGDVEYWRASARLREASGVLLEAAKQFDTAAAQRPRHVSDAAAWSTFVRKLADELHAGPAGAAAQAAPAAGAPPVASAPQGVALPVEPAGSDAGSAAPPPPAPDAGVPSGGVLL